MLVLQVFHEPKFEKWRGVISVAAKQVFFTLYNMTKMTSSTTNRTERTSTICLHSLLACFALELWMIGDTLYHSVTVKLVFLGQCQELMAMSFLLSLTFPDFFSSSNLIIVIIDEFRCQLLSEIKHTGLLGLRKVCFAKHCIHFRHSQNECKNSIIPSTCRPSLF
jgi:hypothetical protein